jgi:hypothetical protein
MSEGLFPGPLDLGSSTARTPSRLPLSFPEVPSMRSHLGGRPARTHYDRGTTHTRLNVEIPVALKLQLVRASEQNDERISDTVRRVLSAGLRQPV